MAVCVQTSTGTFSGSDGRIRDDGYPVVHVVHGRQDGRGVDRRDDGSAAGLTKSYYPPYTAELGQCLAVLKYIRAK